MNLGDAMADLIMNGPIIAPRISIMEGAYVYNPDHTKSANPQGARYYCEGYLCTGSDAACQNRVYMDYDPGQCGPAPVGLGSPEPLTHFWTPYFWSKIVGYSSGCDKYGVGYCQESSCDACVYHLQQPYFGTKWGNNGYFRGWKTSPPISSPVPKPMRPPPPAPSGVPKRSSEYHCETGYEPSCVYWAVYAKGQQPPGPKPGTTHPKNATRTKRNWKNDLAPHDDWPWPATASIYNNSCSAFPGGGGTVCESYDPSNTSDTALPMTCCPNLHGVPSCTVPGGVCCPALFPGDVPYWCPGPEKDFAPDGYFCCNNTTQYNGINTARGCSIHGPACIAPRGLPE